MAEDKIRKYLNLGYVVILLGARQTGKTTLIKKLQNESRNKTFYFLLDDEILVSKIKNNFRFIEEEIEKELGVPLGKIKKEINVFIDEAQKCPAVFELVKIWVDTYPKKIKIILSGSSSLEIQKRTTESLAGRAQNVYLLPLSFGELISAKTNKITPSIFPEIFNLRGDFLRKNQAILYSQKKELDNVLNDVLVFGGLPGVVTRKKEDRFDYLRSIVNTYLEKDIRGSGAVREISVFQKFLELLAFQTGAILNSQNLSTQTQISVKTIKNYRLILENTFSLISLPPDVSLIDQMVKSPKCYLFDVGVANFLSGRATLENVKDSRVFGAIFETLVVSSFLSYSKNETMSPRISYFRDYSGREVDLIVRRGEEEVFPLEITFSPQVIKRKIDNLAYFFDTHIGAKYGAVIYNGDLKEIEVSGKKVFLIPWFLWI